MPIIAIDPAFDRNALPIVGTPGHRLIDDTLETHAVVSPDRLNRKSKAWVTEDTELRPRGSRRPQGGGGVACRWMPMGDEYFGLIEIFHSVNSVSELCVLCGSKGFCS